MASRVMDGVIKSPPRTIIDLTTDDADGETPLPAPVSLFAINHSRSSPKPLHISPSTFLSFQQFVMAASKHSEAFLRYFFFFLIFFLFPYHCHAYTTLSLSINLMHARPLDDATLALVTWGA